MGLWYSTPEPEEKKHIIQVIEDIDAKEMEETEQSKTNKKILEILERMLIRLDEIYGTTEIINYNTSYCDDKMDCD